MDDLAAWLTQVWDEQEKAARNRWTRNPLAPPMDVQYGAGINPDMVTLSPPGSSFTRTMTPEEYQRDFLIPAPDERALARIAADRQILALHKPSGGECGTCCGEPYAEVYWDGEDETVVWQRADLAWPCPTLRLLAQPYADRPGYQEAWKL